MNAQEIIDDAEGLYTYWKIVCPYCNRIICITNHKKASGDCVCAGDIIPTKFYKGNITDGEAIGCICGNVGDVYNYHGVLGDQITDKEYKKIKKELC